jgi:hypothetical protein
MQAVVAVQVTVVATHWVQVAQVAVALALETELRVREHNIQAQAAAAGFWVRLAMVEVAVQGLLFYAHQELTPQAQQQDLRLAQYQAVTLITFGQGMGVLQHNGTLCETRRKQHSS